jgi:hypothetical protein
MYPLVRLVGQQFGKKGTDDDICISKIGRWFHCFDIQNLIREIGFRLAVSQKGSKIVLL